MYLYETNFGFTKLGSKNMNSLLAMSFYFWQNGSWTPCKQHHFNFKFSLNSKIEICITFLDTFQSFYTVQKQAPRKRCTSQPCKKKGSLRWSFHYFNYKPFVKRSNIFSNKCNRYASTKYYCVEDFMYYPIWCLISKKISPISCLALQ